MPNPTLQKVSILAADRTYSWSRGDDLLELNYAIEYLQGQRDRLAVAPSHPIPVLGEDSAPQE